MSPLSCAVFPFFLSLFVFPLFFPSFPSAFPKYLSLPLAILKHRDEMRVPECAPSVTASLLSTHALYWLACCGVLLRCPTCTAAQMFIVHTPHVSYDEARATCSSPGGGPVEARIPAIETKYVFLLRT
ncbi:hypothetical protein TcCL_NonESM04783 [Trypanosoma cruzi]|nr:hypothetical protein TcCL_NonESM04783 [Trypanosoma cruzi]